MSSNQADTPKPDTGTPPDTPGGVPGENFTVQGCSPSWNSNTPKITQNPSEQFFEEKNADTDPPPLLNGDRPDCQVLIDEQWVWGKYRCELNKSRYCPLTRKLETAHLADIANPPYGVKPIEVAQSDIRREAEEA